MGFPITREINKSIQIANTRWSDLQNIHVKMIAYGLYESKTIAFSLALDHFFPELHQ